MRRASRCSRVEIEVEVGIVSGIAGEGLASDSRQMEREEVLSPERSLTKICWFSTVSAEVEDVEATEDDREVRMMIVEGNDLFGR